MKSLKSGVEAQMNVLGWVYKLEIHQNMGSISCLVCIVLLKGKTEEHQHLNNGQKKMKIHVDDLKHPQ